MAKRYIGAIILTVNGVEIECKKVDPKRDMKRSVVGSMNSTGRSKGYQEGVPEYSLTLTTPVQPRGESFDWDNVTDATVAIFDRTGYLIEQYEGCFTKTVGTAYDMGGESSHDIEMGALNHRPADGRKAL